MTIQKIFFPCRQNRWKKRGMCIIPTKFGISFTVPFLNQVRKCHSPFQVEEIDL